MANHVVEDLFGSRAKCAQALPSQSWLAPYDEGLEPEDRYGDVIRRCAERYGRRPNDLDKLMAMLPSCGYDPADELGVRPFFKKSTSEAIVFETSGGALFIQLVVSRNEDMRVAIRRLQDQCEVVARKSGREPPESQRLDEMKGVIREIGDSEVAVSLFDNEDELCLDLARSVFEAGGVPLHEGAGFDFWVERFADGSERPVVRALPWCELSADDRKKIDAHIAELLNGE